MDALSAQAPPAIRARRARGWLNPLRPSRNPILLAELKRGQHRMARSVFVGLLSLLLMAQVVWSVHLLWTRDGHSGPWQDSILGFTYYYAQFTAFHLVLYLCPLLWILPAWKAKERSGELEQLALTSSSRADVFWGFLLPRAGFVFAAIYAFYLTMWPWGDWWLVWFRRKGWGAPDHAWTSLHVAITTGYFGTTLIFNSTVAVWLALRMRSIVLAAIALVMLTLGLDLAGIVVAALTINGLNPSGGGFGGSGAAGFVVELFAWPHILYTLLSAHCHPVFAAIYYPVKWTLAGLMIADVTRRAGAWRWIERKPK